MADFNPFSANTKFSPHWPYLQRIHHAYSIIHGNNYRMGLLDYLTLFTFRFVKEIYNRSKSFFEESVDLFKMAFQDEKNGQVVQPECKYPEHDGHADDLPEQSGKKPWYKIAAYFIGGFLGGVIFGPITLVFYMVHKILNGIVRPAASFALAYLNPLTYLGVGLVHLYSNTTLKDVAFANILNPFGGLIETKDYLYARTLHTNWFWKMVDTYRVIGGYPLSPSDYIKLSSAEKQNPLTNLGLSHRIGLFDFLIVPAFVAFLARKCEDGIQSPGGKIFPKVSAWLFGSVFIPLHWVINGMVRPLIAAVLTYNPVTAIFVALVSGITSIYQLIKYDGFTEQKALDEMREVISQDRFFLNEEKNNFSFLLEPVQKPYDKKQACHVLYKATITIPDKGKSSFNLKIDNQKTSKAAELCADIFLPLTRANPKR